MKIFFLSALRFSVCIAPVFFSSAALAQTGPGGVGNNTGSSSLNFWFRADANVTSSGGAISTWGDASGYGHNLNQISSGNRPTTGTNSSMNNQAVVKYDGASNQYFVASTSGPGVNNFTFFIVANGTSYQSLIRFQDNAGTFVVYPWEFSGAQRTFIISSEGGTGSGIQSGMVNSVNNVAVARYKTNTASTGRQTFINGALNAQGTSVNATIPSQTLYSGRYAGGGEYPTCDVGEMIIYYSALNDAQLVIVENYLAAKFNAPLTANDVYTMDNTANGDFDYDVAGIGRVNSSNIHDDSRGTGLIRILNPTDLGDGEYFMWGHNNLNTSASNTDVPTGVTGRLNRVWRVSEATGDVGSVDIQIDISTLPDFNTLSACDAASAIRLLVDTNNDGNFSDQTPIIGATNIGGSIYRFANVSAISNGNRFTIGYVSPAVTGPGGVGITNGNGSLELWFDAAKGATTASSSVTAWADQSGNGITATPPTATARPTLTNNTINGNPVITFSTDDILELSTNVDTSTPSMFMVGNKASPGTGYMTMLTLKQNLWLAQGSSADQWGMYVDNDALITSLTSSYRVMSTHERNYDDIDLYDAETGVTRTNGTAYHGKTLGTIGANNNGVSNSGQQFFNGNIAELIVFSSLVNSAQRIIISNYLAAKYGLSLAPASDVYTRDNTANGDFDYEVAGIGRVNSANAHRDAKGTGLVRISNPTSLDDGDWLMWGHNNLAAVGSTTDCPSGVQLRWSRQWAVSETGDVGSLDIQFDMTGQGAVTASDLRLLIDHDGDGIYNEPGTIVLSGATALSCNNYVFTGVSLIDDAMRFTIGSSNAPQTSLPVELLSFEGRSVNGTTELTWKTASEHNNDYFTVERSGNGEKFTGLFNVQAAGNSTLPQMYHATDNNAPAGMLYYRLKQTDIDGKSSHSKVIVVHSNGPHPGFAISPNPVKMGENLDVQVSDLQTNAGVQITMYDILGRPVPVSSKLSGNVFTVGTDHVRSSGIYILKIVTSSNSWTDRIYIRD